MGLYKFIMFWLYTTHTFWRHNG